MNEVSILIGRERDQSSLPLYCVRPNEKVAVCKAGEKAHTTDQTGWHLALGLPSLQD